MLHWIFLFLFVITTLGMVAVGGLAALEALSHITAWQAMAVDPVVLLLTVLDDIALYLGILVVLGVLDLIFLVGTVVASLRQIKKKRSDRLVRWAERLERRYPGLGQFGLSERVAPTPEQRRQTLKEQYAAGEISQQEFERRTAELLADEQQSGTNSTGYGGGSEYAGGQHDRRDQDHYGHDDDHHGRDEDRHRQNREYD